MTSGRSREGLLAEVDRLRRRVAELEEEAARRRPVGARDDLGEDRYQALLAAAVDAIVVAEAETGLIVEASRSCETLFGRAPCDIVGKHQTELHPDAEHNFYRETFLEHVRVGGKWQEELVVLHRDGHAVPVEIAASGFVLGGRRMQLGIFHDVSDRKRAEAELARRYRALLAANQELERLHRAREAFLVTVSHELRTPLVTGIGYVELLLEGLLGPVPDPVMEKMKIAERNLRALASMIDRTCEYHSLLSDAGGREVPRGPVDVRRLLSDSAAEPSSAGALQDEVRVEVAADVASAWANEQLVRRALAALLDNAARHAGPEARAVLRARLASPDLVEIAVEDDGPGFDPDIVARAFEPFVRGRPRTKEDEAGAGLGLGLAIVKAVLEAHGGAPHIESPPGGPSRVVFELPTVEAARKGRR